MTKTKLTRPGLHTRWHTNRGVISADCNLCEPVSGVYAPLPVTTRHRSTTTVLPMSRPAVWPAPLPPRPARAVKAVKRDDSTRDPGRPEDRREADIKRERARTDRVIEPQKDKGPTGLAVWKSHRDEVYERRTPAERDEILNEALASLRAGTRRPAGSW